MEGESTWSKVRSWGLENPLSVGSIVLLLVYLALRFQAERFYGSFGVSPEEVGFDSVELVIRQATDLLVSFLKIGLFWSIGYLAGMVPTFYLIGVRGQLGRTDRKYLPALVFVLSMAGALLLTLALYGQWWLLAVPGLALIAILMLAPRFLYPDSSSERAEVRSDLFRWGRMVMVLGTLAYGSWIFVAVGWSQASSDSQMVKEGGWVTDSDYPWQARPAHVRWSTESRPFPLPHCSDLVYLGEADGWVLLYDRREDRTLRLMQSDIDLSLPESSCEYDQPDGTPSNG